MSEWLVEVVKLGAVRKHPNADSLSMTDVHDGYPVVFRTGEFKEGDVAVYVPVDSIVPDDPAYAFLQGKRRIKARKIRGEYSQGLLLQVSPEMSVCAAISDISLVPGTIVHDFLGITKWEPKEERATFGGIQEKGPEGWDFVKYTSIEGLRRHKHILELGEQVVLTEKIHGSNGRFCWDGERLWVGSRNEIKKEDPKTFWWQVAGSLGLAERLKRFPKTIFFGEVYGKGVQDLSYDLQDRDFIVFDTFDVTTMRWNDWWVTQDLAYLLGLKVVPVLYEDPWKGFEEHQALAEGVSTVAGHVREGFVVKPVTERWHPRVGRVIFKLVGEGYNLRKDE
jgi:RNA ligase (TIGR02306 family)